MFWLAPVPTCWLAKNCFWSDGYRPLNFGCGPLLWNSGALTGTFLTSTMRFLLPGLRRFVRARLCWFDPGLGERHLELLPSPNAALFVHLAGARHLELVHRIRRRVLGSDLRWCKAARQGAQHEQWRHAALG